MTRPFLILASASPRRAQLLRFLGVRFRVVPSDAPEVEHGHLSPRELCRLNAYRKARAVAVRFPDALVLGADTLVFLGRRIFGKPATRREAEEMLARLQGRTHHVVTGVALIHHRTGWERVFAVTTAVRFRRLEAAQIRAYLRRVNPLDKAGAYAIQEHGEWLVEEIVGSFTNVVGLPLERVEAELKAWSGRFKGTRVRARQNVASARSRRASVFSRPSTSMR
jgi:septum formation protein